MRHFTLNQKCQHVDGTGGKVRITKHSSILSTGHHRQLYQSSWTFIQQFLRYFSPDQSGQPSHTAIPRATKVAKNLRLTPTLRVKCCTLFALFSTVYTFSSLLSVSPFTFYPLSSQAAFRTDLSVLLDQVGTGKESLSFMKRRIRRLAQQWATAANRLDAKLEERWRDQKKVRDGAFRERREWVECLFFWLWSGTVRCSWAKLGNNNGMKSLIEEAMLHYTPMDNCGKQVWGGGTATQLNWTTWKTHIVHFIVPDYTIWSMTM